MVLASCTLMESLPILAPALRPLPVFKIERDGTTGVQTWR